MGRSNGYRPTNANRAEVDALREQLNRTPGNKWRTADAIMQEITTLLGHKVGPGRGRIKPRACAVCDYFGHTKQWCPRRLEYERIAAERHAKRELAAHAKYKKTQDGVSVDPQWAARVKWLDRRWEAGAAAGGCTARAPAECAIEMQEPCMVCEGCTAWTEAVRAFDLTSEAGACT